MTRKELQKAIKRADEIRGRDFAGSLFEADEILAAGEKARAELEARETAQLSMLDEIAAVQQTELF